MRSQADRVAWHEPGLSAKAYSLTFELCFAKLALTGALNFLALSLVASLANLSASMRDHENLIHAVFIAALAGIAIDVDWKILDANRSIWE
ncbi:hypothetical protein SAMN05880561_105284 [Rhizobium sp. RU33A]|uniref:hypothetical protein n=1 Tax=Rhizobium sp. RU33A TaxID=1907413 RepID=UPI00095754A8|nr:hypothetical protein [Rhizobium sp. RU33A]SIQ89721.1 hypothetical protein SAMN05880561_105284 [Rhizobium sp. RU33A]